MGIFWSKVIYYAIVIAVVCLGLLGLYQIGSWIF